MPGISRLQKLRNGEIRQGFKQLSWSMGEIAERRLQCFGHVERTTTDGIPQNARHGRIERRGNNRRLRIDNMKESITSLRRALVLTEKEGGIHINSRTFWNWWWRWWRRRRRRRWRRRWRWWWWWWWWYLRKFMEVRGWATSPLDLLYAGAVIITS